MPRGGDGAGNLAGRQPGGGLRRGRQQPVAIQRLGRRQHRVVGRRRHAGRQRDQPAQHIHEQPGQRQVGPVGVGGDVEQHDAAGAARRLRHQRRAVGQCRPGMAGKVGRWFGQHLSVDLHLVRHAAGRRTANSPGTAPRRRVRPRTARRQAGVAAEQLHRQQRIGLADRLFGGARSGEADQQAALLHPVRQCVALGTGRQRPVRQDQHRQLALQQRRKIGLAHLGERRQRAAQVIQRPGERRIGGGQVAGEQCPPGGDASARPAARPTRRSAGLPAPAGSAGCAIRAAARSGLCRLSRPPAARSSRAPGSARRRSAPAPRRGRRAAGASARSGRPGDRPRSVAAAAAGPDALRHAVRSPCPHRQAPRRSWKIGAVGQPVAEIDDCAARLMPGLQRGG